jgi:hypothetical protein
MPAPLIETLAKGRTLIGAQVIRLMSDFPQWTKFGKIIGTINVTAAAAAGSDTLIAQFQTKPNDGYQWINLGSPFTTILGTDVEPVQYTLAINAGGSTWWHSELSVLITVAGGTSNFTFSFRLEGNVV